MHTTNGSEMRMRLLAIGALPVLMLQECAPQCTPEASVAVEVPSGADGTGTPGDCASYHDDMEAAGLPVSTFSRIGWRETGCDPWAWVVDSDDTGGAFFGLNFKGSLAGYWLNLCGATTGNIRGNVPLIMECTAAAYREAGLRPWS